MTKSEKKQRVIEQLKPFVPEGFENMLGDLIFNEVLVFKIVKPRNTKLGDFRAGTNHEKPQITVNGNLNKYSFLITSLHEFAHLNTFLKFGHRVKPHGEEWKTEYRKLLVPAIDSNLLPKDIVDVLVNSLVKTKASSCSDINLMRVLKKYDAQNENTIFLESLPKGAEFLLRGKTFKKGELRRNRYICDEIHTGKKYLVHALLEITKTE